MKPSKKFKRQFKNLVDKDKIIKRIRVLTRDEFTSLGEFSSISSLFMSYEDKTCVDMSTFKFKSNDECFQFVFEDSHGGIAKCNFRGLVFSRNFKDVCLKREMIVPIQMFYSDGTSGYGFSFVHNVLPNPNSRKKEFVTYYRNVGIVSKDGKIRYGTKSDVPAWILKYLPRFNENVVDVLSGHDSCNKNFNVSDYQAIYQAIYEAVYWLCKTSSDGLTYSIPFGGDKKVVWGYSYDEMKYNYFSNKNSDGYVNCECPINVYSYFKSIYKTNDSKVATRGIIPLSSLYSIFIYDDWNSTETEIWNNLDSTMKGKF